MIIVFWNLKQIALVDALPKGEKFNASYYTSNILEKLHHLGRGFPDTNGKKLNIHADKSIKNWLYFFFKILFLK